MKKITVIFLLTLGLASCSLSTSEKEVDSISGNGISFLYDALNIEYKDSYVDSFSRKLTFEGVKSLKLEDNIKGINFVNGLYGDTELRGEYLYAEGTKTYKMTPDFKIIEISEVVKPTELKNYRQIIATFLKSEKEILTLKNKSYTREEVIELDNKLKEEIFKKRKVKVMRYNTLERIQKSEFLGQSILYYFVKN